MRKALVYGTVMLAFAILSCQDSKDAVPVSPSIAEYRNVGMAIPTDMGARWIEAYQKSQGSDEAGRLGLLHSVSSAELATVTASVSNLVGVAFHYGVDEAGVTHLILIPVDGSMRLWTTLGGRIYFDSNTNSAISKETARAWAARYEEQNPNGIWFHFFGATVFNDIQSLPEFSELSIVPALNDLDFSQELLLVVGSVDIVSELLLLGGRTATETPIYDASYPCPRCEVQ